MSDKLRVWVANEVVGELCRERDEVVFRYNTDNENQFVSLTMPVRAKSYALPYLLPVFEMHLPEGYLLSVIKKHFAKLTATDDFGLLNILAPSIRGRVHYVPHHPISAESLTLDGLLHDASAQLFQSLVARFALASPLSGVQPKVLANIQNKATLVHEDVIVKSWGDDYPELALNEYLCMTALKLANIPVPEFYLSDDERLFVMKRFDVLAEAEACLGFEDMCVLQAKRKDDKYLGSYEQLAKTIKTFVSPAYKQSSLIQFFKMMVMNHLLQNGDAHLKNFGLIYEDRQHIRLAPAYDVVCTSYYVPQDMTALTMHGTKRWQSKQGLIKFAVESCDLSNKQAREHYDDCAAALRRLGTLIKSRLETEAAPEKRALLVKLKSLAFAATAP